MMYYIKCVLILLLCTTQLTACFSPIATPDKRKYVIDTTVKARYKSWHRPVSIMVRLPETYPAFSTTQMAYTRAPYEVSYYALNSWVAAPAQMIQPLLVKVLQDSQHYKAILEPPFAGRYDYLLISQILNFKQNFTRTPATFDLGMRLQLVDTSTMRVRATKDIRIQQPMQSDNPEAGVYAANQAVSQALLRAEGFVGRIIR